MLSERATIQVASLVASGARAVKARTRDSISMVISCLTKMILRLRQFDYLPRNGRGEIRVIGFAA
jgi:hypothetical protein